jgi:GxxExxY protein
MENTNLSTNYTYSPSEDKKKNSNFNLLFKDESFRIIGASMEVHNNLGCGFLEPIYQEAMEKEFTLQKTPFKAQCPIRIRYKGTFFEKTHTADFVAFENIIVEIKAIEKFNDLHTSQVLNYLKATNLHLGILVNFGAKSLQSKRIIL